MTKEELWQAVLAQVQFNMSPANFATWFKNTKILDKTGEKVIVSVPNNFSKEWLENKYNKSILKILRDLDQEIKEIKYDIAKTVLETKKEIPQQNVFNENQLDFQEFKINKETNLNPRCTPRRRLFAKDLDWSIILCLCTAALAWARRILFRQ
jgi:chromosomal replication initiator protein